MRPCQFALLLGRGICVWAGERWVEKRGWSGLAEETVLGLFSPLTQQSGVGIPLLVLLGGSETRVVPSLRNTQADVGQRSFGHSTTLYRATYENG